MRKIFYIFVFLFLMISAQEISAQIIIVNKKNKITELNLSTIRNIYVGNKITWEDGSLIHLADYSTDSDLRVEFSRNYLKLSPRKTAMLWVRVSLSGKSVPPKVFRNSSQMLSFIAKNEGAIGYLPENAEISSDVKIISIN